MGEFNPEKIKALAEELELERLPDVRETVLDIDVIMRNSREINIIRASMAIVGVHAGIDVLGRYFVRIPIVQSKYDQFRVLLLNGTRLVDSSLESPRDECTITSVQVLWSKIDKHKNVATHWMIDTKSWGEEHIVRGR
ncbi:MAG: hypothetical protein KAY24_19965 [Candidatus Eisenbacteria sp.]|nr:hypothetical protein [Candidatus Eisenbacteria bacterium]